MMLVELIFVGFFGPGFEDASNSPHRCSTLVEMKKKKGDPERLQPFEVYCVSEDWKPNHHETISILMSM